MAALYKMDVLVVFALVLCSALNVHAEHDDHDDHDDREIQTYYMLDYFGRTLDIEEKDEVIVKLAPADNYLNHVQCHMTITTAPNHKLFFHFKEVDLGENDWIRLYGESIAPSHAITNGTCSSKKDDIYTTEGNKGILKFYSNSMGNFGGFEIHINSYYIPPPLDECKSDYFKCKRNRCIKSNLKCNTRDNCGDDSDEHDDCDYHHKHVKLIMKIIGGVIGLIGLTVAVTITICCILSEKKAKRTINKGWTATAPISTTDTKVPVQSGSTPAFTKVPPELTGGPVVSSDTPAPPVCSPPDTEKY